jgi:hypothetical protein
MALPGRGSRPKNTLPLLTSTVKMDAEDPSMRCCFRVVSPSGTYTLQAESEFERAEWIAALQVGCCARQQVLSYYYMSSAGCAVLCCSPASAVLLGACVPALCMAYSQIKRLP